MSDDGGYWRGRRIIDLATFLVLLVPLLFGAMAVLPMLQRLQCPTDTFHFGSLRPGMLMVALLTTLMGMTYLIRQWAVDHWRGLREQLDPEHPNRKTPRWAWRVATTAALIGFPVLVWAALSQYCLTPHNLSFRSEPWVAMRNYGWEQVASVVTTCTNGTRGSWHTSYNVVFDDGMSLNIMDNPRAFAVDYDGIARALHGRPITFDSRWVRSYCGSQYLNLLVNRP